jgi:hypothetical protein
MHCNWFVFVNFVVIVVDYYVSYWKISVKSKYVYAMEIWLDQSLFYMDSMDDKDPNMFDRNYFDTMDSYKY